MLKVLHVSKSFPGVQALDDVSIEFDKGEIHALLGENGAGKSTLIKIISGLYTPDRGSEIYYLNEPYSVHSTREALERGIHTVYQELQVIPEASVAENIMLDKLPTRGKTGILSWKKMNEIAKHHLDEIGLDIDPTVNIGRLSVAQRQLVEIAKAISSDIRLLLLDEPTASLSKDEAAYLFRVMDKLKKEGVLVIFVSHVLEEVLQVADRVSVLRDGRCVVTDYTSNLNRRKIVRSMI
jgi:ribose transport system ATP-binding protein